MSFRENLNKVAERVFNWLPAITENPKAKHLKKFNTEEGVFTFNYNTKQNLLWMKFVDTANTEIVDVGMYIEQISGTQYIVDSFKEEFEMFIAHYEMMMDEI